MGIPKKIKKTAIIFGAKIGDVVNVQPVCRLLKEKYPDSELIFITWPGAKEIAELLPEVNFVEIFDNKGTGKNPLIFMQDILKIRLKHKIDLAVVINESSTYSLIAFLLGAKYRVGRHKSGPSFFLHKKYLLTDEYLEATHVIKNYLKAVEPLGLFTDDYSLSLSTDFDTNDVEYINKLIDEAGYSNYKLIGFSPSSALEHKDWLPQEGKRLIDLINKIPGYKVVLTGEYMAQVYAQEIRELSTDDFLDLSQKTNVKQFAALLRKFNKLITVDTGSAHLAYVFNIPTVVMFFNTLYKIWGPQDTNLHKIIYNPDKYAVKAEDVLKELNLTVEPIYEK